MKKQHYKQVWIESEKDLPKKEGYYFIKINAGDKYEKGSFGDIEKFDPNDEDDRFSWLHSVDYYLAEVKQPKGLTDEEIEKEALNHCAYQGQPERTDEKIKKALENLIFTAGKLWDEVKPIKDTEIRAVTHPIIEEAKIVLASLTLQAQQPSDDNIEKWMDTEYPLYKYPKSRKERKVNTMTCLVRDGIRYSLKAMRDGKIPDKK